MSNKDTKTILKDMREAIKSERNAEAIEKGKSLLQNEPQNYMCHLLLGAAYQSVNKVEAAAYLRKAVAYSAPAPPTVALQGLANCAPTEELPKIYAELLNLLPDKYADYYEKLYRLADNQRSIANECHNIFRAYALKTEKPSEQYRLILTYLAKLWLCYDLDITQSDEQLFKEALETVIAANGSNDATLLLNAYKRYLKLLYKQKDLVNCLKQACLVVKQYTDDVYAYEWICKIYCEHYNSQGVKDFDELQQSIQCFATRLLELNPNSGLAFLVKAIEKYNNEQFIAAHDLLSKVQRVQPNYHVAVELLARVQMKLDAHEMALPLWQQLNKLECLEYAICLSHCTEKKQLNEAIEILQKSETNVEVVRALARCYYKLPDNAKLQSVTNTDLITQAEFLLEPSKAIALLEANADVETFEFQFLLGKLLIKEKNYAAALTCMLKATRLESYHSMCFYYLGCIYYATGDVIRARKCLEKCINMNPSCVDAIYNLSAIYQELKEEELNMALLLNALNHMKLENSQRVHYKLGLHYLNANKWDDAIHSFRAAIKFDVDCIIYWESLGDAYAARGSYHSAIRVFQKTLEMNESNVYAKLQLALLKTTLRMYPEAIEDFDNLLVKHPNYLPGLKGAAEAHIGLAHNMKLDHRYRCCKLHLQYALNHLQNAFISHKRHDMVWLWRLTASIFVKTALMPTSLANLEVSAKLAKSDESADVVVLERNDLLKLATRFYSCAVKLKPNTFLWYELALCYYRSAVYMSTDKDNSKMYLEMAEKACRMAIQAQSDRWQNWNLLGVIQMDKSIDNLELAQHCFVQALNIERKSYTSWTNLGVLYLRLKEIKLANQAFKRAQQSSPIYGNAWIGQAMIAETIAEDEEALDLFRHCLQFEYHSESAIGYAHWICKELANESKVASSQYKHAIESMFADVVALDAINWYTANEEDNSSVAALSFQAFLNIRQQLYRPAVQSYLQAIKLAAAGPERDKILTNLGYLYMKLNQPNEAINVFHMVAEATFKPIIGLALAYFRAEQHQESYMVFSTVLKSLTGSDDHKAACILVAMSAMLYASQGEADTKSMLYQCLPLKGAPIQAVYSAFALGILHKDNDLTVNMLKELQKNENKEKYCADIAYLVAQYYLANKNKQQGLNYILSRVHAFPHCTELRRVLANYLIENFSDQPRLNMATAQIALSAIDLSHRDNKKKNDCIEDAKCLLIASRTLKSVDEARSTKLVQRAIHLNPQDPNAWNVLKAHY